MKLIWKKQIEEVIDSTEKVSVRIAWDELTHLNELLNTHFDHTLASEVNQCTNE